MMVMPSGWWAVTLTAALIAGALSLISAIFCYFYALNNIRSRLPPNMRDPLAARFAIDIFVWDEVIPKTIRRRYFLFLVSCSVLAGCIAASLFLLGLLSISEVFAVLFVLFSLHTVSRWFKYRTGS